MANTVRKDASREAVFKTMWRDVPGFMQSADCCCFGDVKVESG
jgi:hypothetical protein